MANADKTRILYAVLGCATFALLVACCAQCTMDANKLNASIREKAIDKGCVIIDGGVR